jgi:predicted nucleic acid-binding protein
MASRVLYVAEPPAMRLLRAPAVVDCSMLCAVLFDEPGRDEASQRLAEHQLWAPRLLDHEVVNVAVSKVKRGLAIDTARLALDDYAAFPVEVADPVRSEQFDLAARYALTGYDAAYLWLAAELRAPLLTFDKKLADAARRHLESLP